MGLLAKIKQALKPKENKKKKNVKTYTDNPLLKTKKKETSSTKKTAPKSLGGTLPTGKDRLDAVVKKSLNKNTAAKTGTKKATTKTPTSKSNIKTYTDNPLLKTTKSEDNLAQLRTKRKENKELERAKKAKSAGNNEMYQKHTQKANEYADQYKQLKQSEKKGYESLTPNEMALYQTLSLTGNPEYVKKGLESAKKTYGDQFKDTQNKIAGQYRYSVDTNPFGQGVLEGTSWVPLKQAQQTIANQRIDSVGDKTGLYRGGEMAGIGLQAAMTAPLAGGEAVTSAFRQGAKSGLKALGRNGLRTAVADIPVNTADAIRQTARKIDEGKAVPESLDGVKLSTEEAEGGVTMKRGTESGMTPDSAEGTTSLNNWNTDLVNQAWDRAEKLGQEPVFGTDKNGMLHYSFSKEGLANILEYYNNAENPTYTLDSTKLQYVNTNVKDFAKTFAIDSALSFGVGSVLGGVGAKQTLGNTKKVAPKTAEEVAEGVAPKVDIEPKVKPKTEVKTTAPKVKTTTKSSVTQKSTVKGGNKSTTLRKTTDTEDSDIFTQIAKEEDSSKRSASRAEKASALADKSKAPTSTNSGDIKSIGKEYTDKANTYKQLHDELVDNLTDYIKNYKGKGAYINTNNVKGSEIGGKATQHFTTKISENEPWYRDFYKKNGRKPNKSEAKTIAEELVTDLERTGSARIDIDSTVKEELLKAKADMDGYAEGLRMFHESTYPKYSDAEFQTLVRTGLEKEDWTDEMKSALQIDSKTASKTTGKAKLSGAKTKPKLPAKKTELPKAETKNTEYKIKQSEFTKNVNKAKEGDTVYKFKDGSEIKLESKVYNGKDGYDNFYTVVKNDGTKVENVLKEDLSNTLKTDSTMQTLKPKADLPKTKEIKEVNNITDAINSKGFKTKLDNATEGTVLAKTKEGREIKYAGLDENGNDLFTVVRNGKTEAEEISLQELKKLKNMKLTTNALPTKSVGADKAKPVEEYGNLIGRKLFEVSDGNKSLKLIADDKTQALELAKQQGLKGTEAKILHRVKDLDEAKKYAVPDMTQYGRTSDTASTMMNAQILENAPDPTKAREAVKESVEQGDYYKDVIPNHTRYELGQLKKGVVEKAQTRIDTNLDNAIKDLDAAARTGKGTSQDVALGYKLAEKLSSEGRYDELSEVLANTSAILSEAGRTLQAAKLFATLTKDDKALTITRQIERLRSKYPDVSIKVDQSMIDDVVNAATTKEEYAAREALFTHVWNQIPPTWQEKVDAWRHLAMLGNPKTHMRNIVGNALFTIPRAVSDTIGAGLEKALIKSGAFEKAMANVKNADEIYRTKAGIFRQVEPDIKKAAKASFDDKADMLMSGSSKYIEQTRPQGSDVFWTLKNGKRKQTKLGETVDKLAKANGIALEKEDRKFMGIAYRKAFSDYCFANDIKPSDLTDDVLEKVEAYATQQCLEATYRNRNDIAKVLSNCRKRLATVNKDDSQAIKAGKKIGLLVMDSAIPYIKTPANIIAKGIEYSPVGNLMGLYKMSKATNPQEFLRGIEYLAEGITGTGMMTLGVYLAHSGKLNGAIAVEDNKYYKQDLGQQSYALTIGDRSITVDWAVPAALSVLTGVSIYENMKASLLTSEEDGLSKLNSMFNVVIDSLSTLPEPIMELSMLQGVENVLKQGFSSEDKTISSIATNMITNYITQFVPTFGGQIARTTTPERHETTVLGKEGTSKTVEKTARKILNKIPGAINLTEEYINVWGKTEANGSDNVFYRAIYQMLSPAYISKDKSTPVDEELLRLDKSIGSQIDGTVIPSWNATSESKITVDDTEYQMTNEEYTKYKKTVGQAKFTGLQELMTTKEYKKASDTDKAKMVKEVYQKAKDKGVREYVESLGGDVLRSYVVSQLTPTQQKAVGKTISLKNAEKILKAKEQIGGNASHVAQAYYMDLPTKTLKKLGISDTSIDKAKTLKNAGVDYNKMQKEMKSNSKYDYNGDGKLGNTGEVLAYLSTKNWSNEKKWAYLYANTGVKSTSKSKYMSQF